MVVAEIGNNHEGDFEIACHLVREAAECGVDAVKFQTLQARYFVPPSNEARYEQLISYELTYREFERIQQLAKSLGLLFISTPLDLESARFLENLVDCYKIASGDINFYPLIEKVCSTGKPIIFSSGASNFAQVVKTKKFIDEHWAARDIEQDVAVLHCVSSYPTLFDQANLASIHFLIDEIGCTVGYSDHTLGIDVAVLATVVGARIIEKHFTLDKQYSDFRDHQLSADPKEMKALVEQIEQVQVILGKREKVVQECETPLADQIRRSIVAATDLPAGHRIREQDLLWMRPATGLSPGLEDQVIDQTLKLSVAAGELILSTNLE